VTRLEASQMFHARDHSNFGVCGRPMLMNWKQL